MVEGQPRLWFMVNPSKFDLDVFSNEPFTTGVIITLKELMYDWHKDVTYRDLTKV